MSSKAPSVYRRIEQADNPHRDKEILRTLYYEAALSLREMAERLGVSAPTVKEWMDKHDIERRSRWEGAMLKQLQEGKGVDVTPSGNSDSSGKQWSFQD